jgi:hypothetical protein
MCKVLNDHRSCLCSWLEEPNLMQKRQCMIISCCRNGLFLMQSDWLVISRGQG